MSKALTHNNRPKTNLDAVTQFIIYQDVVLTTEQEKLMQRLYFTDEKLRSRKHKRDEIIQLLKNRFGISAYRAEQDICDTQKLFGATRALNKNYLLSQHIDDIQLQIQLAKDARRLELLQGLNNNLTNAINAIPPESKYQDITPTKLVFINNSNKPGESKTIEQLLLEADELLNRPGYTPTQSDDDDEYIPFEESGEQDG